MNKIIKTLTLLFFISGIGLFVAYSSGCFAVKKEGHKEQSKNLALVDDTTIQAEIDSLERVRFIRIFGSKSAIISNTEHDVIDKRLSLLRDTLIQRGISPDSITTFWPPMNLSEYIDSLELLAVDNSTNAKLVLLADSLFQDYDLRIGSSKFSRPGQLLEDIRKRAKIDSLLNLIGTKNTNLIYSNNYIIQAEIDSLKRRKFRMYSSKAIIIGAEKEHAAIDKRLQLLEDILKQRQ